MSPGEKTPFPNPDRRPDLRRGMHACLANNIWGTNYVMWQPYGPDGRDMRFRFVLQARVFEILACAGSCQRAARNPCAQLFWSRCLHQHSGLQVALRASRPCTATL